MEKEQNFYKLPEQKLGISGVIQRTPQERLIELQQLYNSMEYEQNTNANRMKCNCYMDEINEIVKLYPELSNTVQLKKYGFQYVV